MAWNINSFQRFIQLYVSEKNQCNKLFKCYYNNCFKMRVKVMFLEKHTDTLEKYPMIVNILNSVHEMALLLDEKRRIVFFNDKFREFAEEYSLSAEVGLRPGNAFNCIYALGGDDLCGTTDFCRYCGGNKSIEESRQGKKAFSECRIAALNGNAFDLNVSATPIMLDDAQFTLYCIIDISSDTRKQVLEKIFFHDINNIVNGVGLLLDMMDDTIESGDKDELHKTAKLLAAAMNSLRNEIHAQHIITLAEKDELPVSPAKTCIETMLSEVSEFFRTSTTGNGIEIDICIDTEDRCITVDPVLLKRVLINMVKNACEASSKGQKVTIGFKTVRGKVQFCVHNESVIPDDVRGNIFKRSFSTKGKGRGLGTYSMRLLTERYLKGRIYFETSEEFGTEFCLELNIS